MVRYEWIENMFYSNKQFIGILFLFALGNLFFMFFVSALFSIWSEIIRIEENVHFSIDKVSKLKDDYFHGETIISMTYHSMHAHTKSIIFETYLYL